MWEGGFLSALPPARNDVIAEKVENIKASSSNYCSQDEDTTVHCPKEAVRFTLIVGSISCTCQGFQSNYLPPKSLPVYQHYNLNISCVMLPWYRISTFSLRNFSITKKTFTVIAGDVNNTTDETSFFINLVSDSLFLYK